MRKLFTGLRMVLALACIILGLIWIKVGIEASAFLFGIWLAAVLALSSGAYLFAWNRVRVGFRVYGAVVGTFLVAAVIAVGLEGLPPSSDTDPYATDGTDATVGRALPEDWTPDPKGPVYGASDTCDGDPACETVRPPDEQYDPTLLPQPEMAPAREHDSKADPPS